MLRTGAGRISGLMTPWQRPPRVALPYPRSVSVPGKGSRSERRRIHRQEEYIVSWARELPDKRPIRIAVHIPDGDAHDANSKELNEAFHRYFAGRAVAAQHELNELFRVGRRSLAIGIPILVACFTSARLAAGYLSENPVQRLVPASGGGCGGAQAVCGARAPRHRPRPQGGGRPAPGYLR